MHAHSHYTTITIRDETLETTTDGAHLIRNTGTFAYTGDFVGQSMSVGLRLHRSDNSGVFTGFEILNGALHGQQGSFVAQFHGHYDSAGCPMTWTIVEGSGTGELAGVRGGATVTMTMTGDEPLAWTFDYELAPAVESVA